MAAQRSQARAPLYVLVVGVILQIIAGSIAFLTDIPLVALVLCMVGLVCLGGAGDALSRG